MELWNSLINNNFLGGIIASFIVAISSFLLKCLIGFINSRSPFTGYWYSLVYEKGTIVKSDWYRLHHNKRTGKITGKMGRLYPPDQKGRKWMVFGVLNRPNLILYSHSNELNVSMASAVCRLTKDDFFEGYYLRYSENKKKMETIMIHYHKVNIHFWHKNELDAFKAKLVGGVFDSEQQP